MSLAVVPLAAFISCFASWRSSCRCEPRLHLVEAVMLYLTILFVLGLTMNSELYCPRTIQRETKGTFRPSRNVPLGSVCISALGRPLCRIPGT